MEELYSEERDLNKWIRQVQFSLHLGNFEHGLLIIYDYERSHILKEIEIKKDCRFLANNLGKFTEFFIDNVFYDNSSLRRVKEGIRKIVKAGLFKILREQIERNHCRIFKSYVNGLDKHFEKQTESLFNQDQIFNKNQ